MMIDNDTLKQLLRMNDALFQLCKSLTDKRDIETWSRLIPLVDQLTHILIEAGKNKLHWCNMVEAKASGRLAARAAPLQKRGYS
jgi:hypothetical protein